MNVIGLRPLWTTSRRAVHRLTAATIAHRLIITSAVRLRDEGEQLLRSRPYLDSPSIAAAGERIPTVGDAAGMKTRFEEWKEYDNASQVRKSNHWTVVFATIAVSGIVVAIPLYVQSTSGSSVAISREDAIGKPDLGGPWTLVDTSGRLTSSTDFRGKYQLIYFGFTFCPDICPEELEKQSRCTEILDKKYGPVVQPLYITIDPARDTLDQMRVYCSEFHPRLVGLTGTPGQIKKVARLFRVYYNQGIKTDETDYLVDHSIITYLMDRQGKFLDFFGRNMTAHEIAGKIAKHIENDRAKAATKKRKKVD